MEFASLCTKLPDWLNLLELEDVAFFSNTASLPLSYHKGTGRSRLVIYSCFILLGNGANKITNEQYYTGAFRNIIRPRGQNFSYNRPHEFYRLHRNFNHSAQLRSRIISIKFDIYHDGSITSGTPSSSRIGPFFFEYGSESATHLPTMNRYGLRMVLC